MQRLQDFLLDLNDLWWELEPRDRLVAVSFLVLVVGAMVAAIGGEEKQQQWRPLPVVDCIDHARHELDGMCVEDLPPSRLDLIALHHSQDKLHPASLQPRSLCQ